MGKLSSRMASKIRSTAIGVQDKAGRFCQGPRDGDGAPAAASDAFAETTYRSQSNIGRLPIDGSRRLLLSGALARSLVG
jgi:hypothetical protein